MVKENVVEAKNGQGNESSQTKVEKLQHLERNDSDNNVLNQCKSEIKGLDFYYGEFHALKNVNMLLHEKRVTALIGPSGCGK